MFTVPVDGLVVRPLARYQHDARLHFVAHVKCQSHRAAIVHQPHLLALAQVARGGIGGMQDAVWLAFALTQEGDAGKRSVAQEVSRAGQQTQRPPRGLDCLDRIGLPIRHRRQSLLRQRLGIELQLAGWRTELLPRLRGNRNRTGVAQRVGIECRNRPRRAAEQLPQDFGLRHAEHRVGQAHPPGQGLRQLQVGPCLALRRHRAVAVLHVIGAVGAEEVLGLEIRCRRQHDVGVARGRRSGTDRAPR